MDLLYHLIQKNEIDIHDIPITELADQYMLHLRFAPKEMESMSEFLLMAATLVEIKSKMLLPKPIISEEPEEDPRAELAARLLEYREFKQISELLREKEAWGSQFFYRPSDKDSYPPAASRIQPIPETLGSVTMDMLYRLFMEALDRREMRTDKIRAGFHSIERDVFTVRQKTDYLVNLLRAQKRFHFSEAFDACGSKGEQVVTFLALLELIKANRIRIEQEKNFCDIIVLPGRDANEI